MYDFFEGTIDHRGPTNLVIDVNGVGYALFVPLGTPGEVGSRQRIWVHLTVREDAHTLYGFASIQQRQLFRMLLSVRGVGPSVALNMLSSLDSEQVTGAILAGNKAVFTSIKGVGKKTADQIMLDLGEKVARLGSSTPFVDGQSKTQAPRVDDRLQDAISALVSIGYKEKDALKLVERADKDSEDLTVEDLIRCVLRG
jgi:Holliday junction DNA helicase RuvA